MRMRNLSTPFTGLSNTQRVPEGLSPDVSVRAWTQRPVDQGTNQSEKPHSECRRGGPKILISVRLPSVPSLPGERLFNRRSEVKEPFYTFFRTHVNDIHTHVHDNTRGRTHWYEHLKNDEHTPRTPTRTHGRYHDTQRQTVRYTKYRQQRYNVHVQHTHDTNLRRTRGVSDEEVGPPGTGPTLRFLTSPTGRSPFLGLLLLEREVRTQGEERDRSWDVKGRGTGGDGSGTVEEWSRFHPFHVSPTGTERVGVRGGVTERGRLERADGPNRRRPLKGPVEMRVDTQLMNQRSEG